MSELNLGALIAMIGYVGGFLVGYLIWGRKGK